MKVRSLTLFALLFSSVANVSARIGEGPLQIELRYGHGFAVSDAIQARIPKGGTAMLYQKDGINIVVFFLQNRSVCEIYTKQKEEEFSRSELDSLLAANEQGVHWILKDESAERIIWKKPNGMTAIYLSHPHPSMVVRSAEFAADPQPTPTPPEEKPLKGF